MDCDRPGHFHQRTALLALENALGRAISTSFLLTVLIAISTSFYYLDDFYDPKTLRQHNLGGTIRYVAPFLEHEGRHDHIGGLSRS